MIITAKGGTGGKDARGGTANTGTITGGPLINSLTADAGDSATVGTSGTGNTGTINGNVPPATGAACTVTGGNSGTVKNCTSSTGAQPAA